MIIKGETKQKEPTPTEPKQIENKSYIPIQVNGYKMYIIPNNNRKIKRIFQELGRWYIEYEK